MSNTNSIQEFKQNINEMAQRHVKVQTVWARVKSVDWDSRLMVATGVVDNLDYEDVQLGIGFRYIKPKIGTMCLLGLIENNDAATYLIEAAEVEEYICTVGTSVLTVTKEGFKMERGNESLTKLLDDLLQAQLLATYTNGAGTTSVANNANDFAGIKTRFANLLK